jgi:hypothetical protein
MPNRVALRAPSLLSALLCSAALCGAPIITRADEPGARRMLEQGIAFYNDGRLVEARNALEQALAMTREPHLVSRARLYLGLNAFAENLPARARQHFREALLLDSSLELDRERYKPAVVATFEEVRQASLGLIIVISEAPVSVVWIDGARAGRAPYRGWISPGEHRVEVEDGKQRSLYAARIRVSAGTGRQINVAAPSVAAPSEPSRRLPRKDRRASPRTRRIWTWVAGGGALAVAAAAIGVGLSAWSDRDEACALMDGRERKCDQRDRLVDSKDAGRYAALYDRFSDKALAANVLWGVAGALAVSSVVLYFVERPGSRETNRSSRADLLLGPHGLQLRLSY